MAWAAARSTRRERHALAKTKRGFGFCLRRIATSWRRTRISAFLAAVVRLSSTSQPSTRQKIRYSRRGDIVHYHSPIPTQPRRRWSTPHGSKEPYKAAGRQQAAPQPAVRPATPSPGGASTPTRRRRSRRPPVPQRYPDRRGAGRRAASTAWRVPCGSARQRCRTNRRPGRPACSGHRATICVSLVWPPAPAGSCCADAITTPATLGWQVQRPLRHED